MIRCIGTISTFRRPTGEYQVNIAAETRHATEVRFVIGRREVPRSSRMAGTTERTKGAIAGQER